MPDNKVGIRGLILSNPAVSIMVLMSAASIAGLFAIFWARHAFANDFGVYWSISQTPTAAVYAPRLHNPFAYPPTMLLWVQPLAWLPKWPAFFLWVGASIAALIVATRKFLTPGGITLLLLCPPAFHCFSTGQVSAALAAILIAAFRSERKELTGLLLAIIASVKPQYVLLAPLYLMISREWRILFWAGLALMVIVGLTTGIFGGSIWSAWVRSFPNFHEVLIRDGVLNVAVTPAGVAENLGTPAIVAEICGAVIGILIILFARPSGPLEQAAILSSASILAAPYALVYDLMPMAPFLAMAILNRRIGAALALSGALSPLPLLLTGWELVRSRFRSLDRWSASGS